MKRWILLNFKIYSLYLFRIYSTNLGNSLWMWRDLLELDKHRHVGYRVCALHFETKRFLNDSRKILQPSATPMFLSLEKESEQLNYHNYSFFNKLSVSQKIEFSAQGEWTLKNQNVVIISICLQTRVRKSLWILRGAILWSNKTEISPKNCNRP